MSQGSLLQGWLSHPRSCARCWESRAQTSAQTSLPSLSHTLAAPTTLLPAEPLRSELPGGMRSCWGEYSARAAAAPALEAPPEPEPGLGLCSASAQNIPGQGSVPWFSGRSLVFALTLPTQWVWFFPLFSQVQRMQNRLPPGLPRPGPVVPALRAAAAVPAAAGGQHRAHPVAWHCPRHCPRDGDSGRDRAEPPCLRARPAPGPALGTGTMWGGCSCPAEGPSAHPGPNKGSGKLHPPSH